MTTKRTTATATAKAKAKAKAKATANTGILRYAQDDKPKSWTTSRRSGRQAEDRDDKLKSGKVPRI
jgi:hypothetical protein